MTAKSQGKNEVSFYVALTGDDNWSGKRVTPDAQTADGPFATIERARDAVRELKRAQGGVLRQPVKVSLRGGTHFLSEILVFTSEDSGTAECPVTYTACRKEKPVISGGRRITNWKQVTVKGRQHWAADLPQVKQGKWYFHQLWVNGQRRGRSRYPKKGYLQIAEVPDKTPEAPWSEGQTTFRFHEGDLKAWKTVRDAEVVAMNRWVESRLPVAKVDEENRVVSFGKRSVFSLDPGDPYYVEHAFEIMDSPGEWYLNRKTGTLYYLPMPGEDMREAEVIAPVLPQLLRLEGRPEVDTVTEHLAFRDLAFAHTEWYFPQGSGVEWLNQEVGGFGQAAVGVPGAVHAEGARSCVFENCSVAHVGGYGIHLTRGSQNNRISRCRIHDLGAGGIKIGETVIRSMKGEQAAGNAISDCRLYDGGRIFHSAVGLWIGQSYDNHIAHNLLHDFYYSALSIGWTWGYTESLAHGNVVEFNHIHHIGVRSDGDGPILSDMGGIYTLGMQPGTVIRNNVFHDIAALRYGGWGIYFDEGSTHLLAENNLVYRTTHGGFHQHYGKENLVRNNLFAFGRDMQITRTRPEEHLSLSFEGNIVYWREGVLLSGSVDHLHFLFDRNLYWREGGGEIRFGEMSLREWQKKRMDRHSLIADPLLVGPGKADFRLEPGSPAIPLGFRPLDLSEVGPRK